MRIDWSILRFSDFKSYRLFISTEFSYDTDELSGVCWRERPLDGMVSCGRHGEGIVESAYIKA